MPPAEVRAEERSEFLVLLTLVHRDSAGCGTGDDIGYPRLLDVRLAFDVGGRRVEVVDEHPH
jgi:hypothetical protein